MRKPYVLTALLGLWPQIALSNECPVFPEHMNLRLMECQSKTGGVLAYYAGANKGAEYSTEFDKRRVVIAVARGDAQLKKLVPGAGAERTRLVDPPQPEQIRRRESKRTTHKGWTLYHEVVQYVGPSGGPGFVLECVSASTRDKNQAFAVEECFLLEEKQRFLSVLDYLEA